MSVITRAEEGQESCERSVSTEWVARDKLHRSRCLTALQRYQINSK